MSLYPSLEDMVVGQNSQPQQTQQHPSALNNGPAITSLATSTTPYPQLTSGAAYPSLGSYMDLNLTAADMPPSAAIVPAHHHQRAAQPSLALAPVTGVANQGM